jgi:hypothetical protein
MPLPTKTGLSGPARKGLGTLLLFTYLPAYVIIAVTIGGYLNAIAWAALVFYAVAGIAWIFPLRPLFRWMNAADG